jgi:isopentenyl-diphosphate delta-isomerase
MSHFHSRGVIIIRQQRKNEHLIIANQSCDGPALSGFADIHLLHDAIPELETEEINLKVKFLERDVNYPLIINAITGGTEQAGNVNRCLAAIASKYGLAMEQIL